MHFEFRKSHKLALLRQRIVRGVIHQPLIQQRIPHGEGRKLREHGVDLLAILSGCVVRKGRDNNFSDHPLGVIAQSNLKQDLPAISRPFLRNRCPQFTVELEIVGAFRIGQ